MALFNSMKQVCDAMGDTKTPMWVMIGGNVLNLILNYLLIFTFDLGLLGAGLATLVVRMLMPLVLFIAIHHGPLFRSPNFLQARQASSYHRYSRQGLLSLVRLGLPISVQMCLEAGSFNVVALFMGWIGATALAAHQMMGTVSTLGFMVYYGIGAAAAIRIAYFRAQEEWDEVRQTAHTALWMSLASAVVVVALIWGTLYDQCRRGSPLPLFPSRIHRLSSW